MPTALLGAASCVRCGSSGREHGRCERCGYPWLPSAPVDLTHAGSGALAGVVRASIGRRLTAHLVDLLILLALTAGGVGLLVMSSDPRGWLLVGAAVVALIVQTGCLLRMGRTIGRGLLGVRAVDDLTGTPVGLGRWLRAGRRVRFLAADLRHGRDPWRVAPPRASAPDSSAVHASRPAEVADEAGLGPARALTPARTEATEATRAPEATRATEATAAEPSEVAAVSTASTMASLAAFSSSAGRTAGAGVAIVTDNGDRHEIDQVLLVGRSPVDPQPGPGRALLAWPDLSRRLAKTHLMLEWSGTVLWVTDLESLTGTSVATPDGTRMPLAPGVRFAAGIGSVIFCGGRSVTVVPGV